MSKPSVSKPAKQSLNKLPLWSSLAAFVVVELGIGLSFYFHEANQSNEGANVLFGSLQFALLFAIPAGLIVGGLIWGLKLLQSGG
jgi:hypothetical protein